MSDKKAFVFDTNFIIQNKKLDKVVKELSDRYVAYVTQMSIEERIAQHCREDVKAVQDVTELQKKYGYLFSVEINCTLEENEIDWRKQLQNNYELCFNKRVIPFTNEKNTLEFIINRANKKLPPFSDAKDASDKGFKDCIIWYLILEYFKNHGEKEVLFISNDQGFLKNAEYFINEFNEVTGKTIEIKPTSFYKEMLNIEKPNDRSLEENVEKEIPNIDVIREKIITVVEKIRSVEYYNDFGDENWDRTFITSKYFDKEYIQLVFEGLSDSINKHYLENSIIATEVLEYDNRITNGNIEIPIGALEDLLKLYRDIKSRFPQFLEQLFEATAKILNRNYEVPQSMPSEYDLPF